MAESFIQVPADSDGKKIRTNKLSINGNEVHSDVQTIADSAGNLINPAKEDGNIADIKSSINYVKGFSIPPYDYIENTYDTNNNLIKVVYRNGGASGTIVATLDMTYDANSNLTSISKS